MELNEVGALAENLSISPVEAAGYIALVCSFAIKYADDYGQIDFLTDKAIETACYWQGQRGELIKAFCASGVCVGCRDSDDDPLSIASGLWSSVAGETIVKRIKARERKQKERSK